MAEEDQMFMRDLFAGLAMCGFVIKGDHFTKHGLAEDAYAQADAMMEAREGKKAGLPPIKRKGK
jgi:hypothetical protein